jgi:SWI/SNF-related matrix-associated actin-dependent regulator 1 of chromatin subfamily A
VGYGDANDEERWELYPYQVAGAAFLAERSFALLGDAMGVGKSAQAIRACDLRFAGRILVICPAIARVNWAREFHRFGLLGLATHVLLKRTDRPAAAGVTICSYDYASASKALQTETWDVVIVDEAHYLKSLETARTKAVFGKKGIVHRAKAMWCLTGTPMTNHVGDLWPILFVSGATTLKYNAFMEQFAKTINGGFAPKIVGVKNAPELKQLLGKIMLRRRKEDVLKQLPPIQFSTFAVEPGPVDLEIVMYELWRRAGGEEKLKAVIDGQEALVAAQIESLKNTKAPMRNLIPILTGMEKGLAELRQYTGMAKVPAIVDIVTRELNAKPEDGGIDKIVIFACHRSVIESLRQAFRKYGAVTLYGGTTPEGRQRNIDKFQNNPNTRVFIANIQAAGTAVTLTAACEVLFAECDWTPANNAQAAMRVHRISQARPVRVRYATLADSTDEYLTETLRRKTRDELAVFGD